MKFIKGVIIGGLITTGVAMMYTESMEATKRKMIKKGKNIAKKIGIL